MLTVGSRLQVGAVQRKFVVKMLSFPSFNKHLLAVREMNLLLKRALLLKQRDDGLSAKVWKSCRLLLLS